MIELAFPLYSQQSIPADHGYALYGAISTVLPSVHDDNEIGIHPIRGRLVGDRQLALQPWSRITLRIRDVNIAQFLPLAGKQLRIGTASVRVGVPQVQALVPATALRSRLVIIKVAHVDAESLTPETFTAAARKQLQELSVSDQVLLTIPNRPPRDGDSTPQPRRRTLRVKDSELVGYEVVLEGLTAEESIKVQEAGVGQKRKMGCGVFTAIIPRSVQ